MLLTEFQAQIEALIRRETHSLVSGGCGTIEEYKKKIGFIAGLNKALDIMVELVKVTPKEERF